jgi:signal transduction protein with GAF and PtsI domain
MGFDALSVSPAALPRVKWAVRRTTSARLHSLAADALRCSHQEELGDLLDRMRLEIGLQSATTPSGKSPEVPAAVMVQQHAATPGAAQP